MLDGCDRGQAEVKQFICECFLLLGDKQNHFIGGRCHTHGQRGGAIDVFEQIEEVP